MATAPSYPGLGGSTQATVTLQGPPQTIARPPGGAPAAISVFPGFGALGGLTFDVPGQSAAFQSAPLTRPVQVTGSPVIQLRVTGQSAITLFAKLYDVDQAGNAILPDQLAAPFTVPAGEGRNITVQLPAIDHSFAAGHQLRLVAVGHRLRLRHPAGRRRLPGRPGQPGPVRPVRPGARPEQQRPALVDLGRPHRRAGRRGPDPGHPAPPPSATTSTRTWPTCRWRSPA